MEVNVGDTDRIVRLVLGVALAVVGVAWLGGVVTFGAGVAGTVAALVAVLVAVGLLATGATRTCPVYLAADVDTTGGEETADVAETGRSA